MLSPGSLWNFHTAGDLLGVPSGFGARKQREKKDMGKKRKPLSVQLSSSLLPSERIGREREEPPWEFFPEREGKGEMQPSWLWHTGEGEGEGREWYYNAKFTCKRKRRGEIGGKKGEQRWFLFLDGGRPQSQMLFLQQHGTTSGQKYLSRADPVFPNSVRSPPNGATIYFWEANLWGTIVSFLEINKILACSTTSLAVSEWD